MTDVIHVWRCDLDGGTATEKILDPLERERAAAFRFPYLRRRYVVAHCFLRSVLAGYLETEPAAVTFGIGGSGKPYLRNLQSPQFNLSHADGVAYLAITNSGDIGIDVELSHHVEDAIEVGLTVFSLEEMTALREQSSETLDSAFLHAWTRKEAYVKALALGIGSVDLRLINVGATADPITVAPIVGVSSAAVHVRSLCGVSQELVAVATTQPPGNIAIHEFTE